jgi:hypothetical protein
MKATAQAGKVPTTRSNPAKLIDLLTVWSISVDFGGERPA